MAGVGVVEVGRARLLVRAVCCKANLPRIVLAAACSWAGVDGFARRALAFAAAEAAARWEALVMAIVPVGGGGSNKEKSSSFEGLVLKTRPGVPDTLADRWVEAVGGFAGCRGRGKRWFVGVGWSEGVVLCGVVAAKIFFSIYPFC